ncbi:FG-GAP-like repeat-containing protein [Tunturibacter psychrotolerans]|uniref:FG-GAP-like repeat-containing protein n=1 Tax=Tunturiibacter psychrotolerans TaxID=3069686 RepID=A0AAU7ZPK9_9BACT
MSFHRSSYLKVVALWIAAIGLFFCEGSQPLFAGVPTTTTLGVTSGGNTVNTVSSGSLITLTATVLAGSAAVTTGQVNFCDASAPYCTDIHILGTAQLSTAGTATLNFVPGIGSHSYKSVFQGTSSDAASSSSVSSLTVTGSGSYPTITSIVETGIAGNYTLAATLSGNEGIVPTGTVSFLDTNNTNFVLATALLGTGQSVHALGFLNSSNPGTNPNPQSVAVADFNGDGKADLAISVYSIFSSRSVVSILLGNGDGTFTTAPAVPVTGMNAGSIVAGDFNGDGKPDFVITLPDNNALLVMLGNGDGTFTQGQKITDADIPFFVTTGDFNADGKADLAVANPSGRNVTVLLGNGDGTFTTVSTPALSGVPVSIAVGDFNGDGNADLAVADEESNTVTVLLGKGDGTFTETASSPATGSDPLSIVTGDFNGDGNADLAVANGDNDSVTILLGVGDGTFTPGAAMPATGSLPYSVAVGDFNGDGKADLATSNVGSNTATVFLGNGDGTFTMAASPPAGSDPLFAAVGDFNGDGFADLVAINNNTNSATVLLSQLTEMATATVSGVSPLGTGPHAVVASYPGDVNYSASVSGTTTLTAQTAMTTLSLTANPTNATYGGQVVLTAIVSPPLVQGLNATGTITFYSGSTSLGTATLSSGVATLNVTSLAVGADSITASYAGDTNFAGATSSSIRVTITAPLPASTTLSLSANPTNAAPGGQVILTATLSPSRVQGLSATGAVTFYNGSTSLGTATLSSGAATLNVTSLPVGADSITASYAGDANFASATSSSTNVTVIAPIAPIARDFSIAINPSALTVGQGSTGNVVLTIAPTGGFNQQVQFSCSGLPADSLCTFSPATVTPNGAAVVSTLTISTNVQTSSLAMPRNSWLSAVMFFVPGGFASALGCVGLRRRKLSRRRRIGINLFLVLSVLTMGIATGCGSSSKGNQKVGATTYSGTSTVSVAASTSAGSSHSTSLNLTITSTN